MPDFSNYMGWVNRPKDIELVLSRASKPYMSICGSEIKESGKGKIQLLYKVVEMLNGGKYPVLLQDIGDCVSMGAAGAIDTLKAVEIILRKEYENWETTTCTEYLYYTSRVLVGKGSLGENQDGSTGGWVVEAMKEYGVLLRKKYGNVDLSSYSGQRAKTYGSPRQGAPKELITYGKEHRIGSYTQVRSYEEVRDAIYNLYPVIICSNQGFSSQRDNDGFLKPQGNWGHCMVALGSDAEYKRPGILIQNSWGPTWVTGPKRHGQPDGSFWCDASVVDRMVKQNDSWAISSFDGYPKQDIDWNVSKKAIEKLKDFKGLEK